LREGVEGGIGCREHLDIEALKKSAGAELRSAQRVVDDVVVLVSVVGAEAVVKTELLLEGVIDPQARGCSTEEEIVLREDPSDLARIGLLFAV
jgi:hypothetical protein